MNVALLLAGGAGLGISSDVPKQYIRVNGKMLITYSLETLIAASHIDEIQIVAEHEWREYIIADCKEHGINTDKIRGFAIPGFSRQASILNGLQNILREKNGQVDINNIEEDDNVLIHEAFRPLITTRQIDDYFGKMSDGYDGVIPVLFNLRKYYQANMALMPDKLKEIKDSAEPAIIAGMNLSVVLGDKSSFKITTQKDLEIFANMVDTL